ncbi:MAG: hypothetical protein HXY27_06425 [Hydrogenophilaceae bacterium]|nr:hypothetical protein [Hydrogenophilaceae bacterium]
MAATVSAHALGLGNLTVSSHLGQPLNARITLLGNPADLEPNCIKLVPVNGYLYPLLQDINIRIDRTGPDPGLIIQSRQAVNDPALMFAVSIVCPERIQRDYALLLDPPVLSKDVPVVAANSASTTGKSSSLTANSQSSGTTRAGGSAVANAPLAKRTKQAASKHTPKRVVRWPESNGPRLVLTGSRRLFSPATAQLALNMDVGLLDTSRRAESPLNADELTDENTALTRKLAYLEETLATLKRRNAELQQARAKALQAGAPTGTKPPKAPGKSTWTYFLAGLVLLTGAAAYVMYRRRQQSLAKYDDSEIWHMPADLPGLAKPAAEAGESQESGDAPQSKAATSKVPDQHEYSPISSLISKDREEGTEVKDSVADEVEVFVAHGHADLAIHMLEDHIDKNPEESPVPWLLLLDLLKREGAESKYEDYRLKCKTHFNVSMPSYGEAEVQPAGQGLESFPHILSELVRLWPTEEVIPYLDDLIYDRRGGALILLLIAILSCCNRYASLSPEIFC